MLANALACVALIGLGAATILSAGSIGARLTIRHLAANALVQTYQAALDALQSDLTTLARAGPIPNPLPSLNPVPAVCIDARNPCPATATATLALVRSDSAGAAGCDPSQTACAENEQTNSYIGEGRIIAHISASVRSADGTLLAARDGDVVLRTLNVAPYVTVAGSREASFDDRLAGQGPGDDGGAVPATANPCTPTAAGSSDDTVIRVAYRNAQTGACTDGSAWRTITY